MRSIIFTFILITTTLWISCSDKTSKTPIETNFFIRAADLSLLPKIELTNAIFYNLAGDQENMLTTLKNNGINTVRLRIWNNPVDYHSSFEEVSLFSQKLKNMGFKVWISVHYSDTWADPGSQVPPSNWQDLPFSILKDSMSRYTEKIMTKINPDYIQIGNEINPGILLPYGNINSNEAQFIDLITSGVEAVRNNSSETKIIIHYAGIDGSEWFFNKLKSVDYDIMGLSYYPIWHGEDLVKLKTTITNLVISNDKEIIIAETAYPFTLGWNDWTNNIVGLEDQLILPDYPATSIGQKKFIFKIRDIMESTEKGIGYCYWGGELIAFDGPESQNGSPWENQAFYDFNNKALEVLEVFNE